MIVRAVWFGCGTARVDGVAGEAGVELRDVTSGRDTLGVLPGRTPQTSGAPCGRFQPADPPWVPYRCTLRVGHGGGHEAVSVTGRLYAAWPRREGF